MGRYEGPWWAPGEEHVVEHRPTPPEEVGGVFAGGQAYISKERAREAYRRETARYIKERRKADAALMASLGLTEADIK